VPASNRMACSSVVGASTLPEVRVVGLCQYIFVSSFPKRTMSQVFPLLRAPKHFPRFWGPFLLLPLFTEAPSKGVLRTKLVSPDRFIMNSSIWIHRRSLGYRLGRSIPRAPPAPSWVARWHPLVLSLPLAPIRSIAWKECSAKLNFRFTQFWEVRYPQVTPKKQQKSLILGLPWTSAIVMLPRVR
jgi:hypothetical protein